MTAYYNEFDPKAAAWLRELIKRGLIADGIVDERSILDVEPDDLHDFTQCHFFAGIGGWSYALRLAGWPDDRPVWTGSPPCQPFSSAGARKGKEDERHLAPHFVSLVSACRPELLLGEQVASAAVFGKAAGRDRTRPDGTPEWAWVDDLSDRLEAARYAVGAVDFPSAGVGAPHIRQRTYFGAVRLADTCGAGLQRGERGRPPREERQPDGHASERGVDFRLADSDRSGQPRPGVVGQPSDTAPQADREVDRVVDAGGRGGMADAASGNAVAEREQCDSKHGRKPQDRGAMREGREGARDTEPCNDNRTNAPHGGWSNPDWLFCRDGKWRPVEPGTFPLAHGIPARVVRLRGYGNAINPKQASEFILSFDAAVRSVAAGNDNRPQPVNDNAREIPPMLSRMGVTE